MKKNIALVAGGYSGEYEISINSARRVLANIDRELFEVFLVIINRESWLCEDANGTPFPLDRTDFTIVTASGKLRFDMAMIIIHGTPGEDGKLQGYFDMTGIPYNTCSHDTSAATFNKYYCKLLVHTLGLPLAKHQFYTNRNQPDSDAVIAALGLPLFVKPNQNGSSVGISKAHTKEELEKAIEHAFSCDTEILIEEFIKGREITCGVIRLKNEMLCLPLCEIVSKKEFFDYEAKYTPGMADELVPAPLTDDLADRCTELSRKLYDGLNCKGIVRFDYILSNNEFFFLEVNTVPGLSAGSIVPKMVRAHGWTEGEFYTRMIGEIMC
jgi:D-alanine-D-alanine ligase